MECRSLRGMNEGDRLYTQKNRVSQVKPVELPSFQTSNKQPDKQDKEQRMGRGKGFSLKRLFSFIKGQ